MAEAIRGLAVRGAPAIGVAAAYGYALAVERGEDPDEARAVPWPARPTAANLAWALEEVRSASDPAARARELHEEEVERCRLMSAHAADLIGAGSSALTHCNTGALATGGQGTALGAIQEAWMRGFVRHVFVDETRPLLQGARLTAWELAAAGIPHTVVADAAPARCWRRVRSTACSSAPTGSPRTGTRRTRSTYPLAVLADRHAVPFTVVAPTSTVDLETPTGAEIPIEERDPSEVSTRFAARNPAFDVTPAELISAIVTEHGVHRGPYAESLAAGVPA